MSRPGKVVVYRKEKPVFCPLWYTQNQIYYEFSLIIEMRNCQYTFTYSQLYHKLLET